MSVRHWRWKYRLNADLSACLLAIDLERDALAGFVGGVRVPFWHAEHDLSAVHTLDHMIDPSYRRGLGRAGVFSELISRWVGAQFGPGRAGLGFGFPSRANFRVGERVARYRRLMPVTCLVHAGAWQGPCRDAGLEGTLRAELPEDTDELWLRCRARYPMMVARTREYLRWRYEQHPDVDYAFAQVRRGGQLLGLAVVRDGGVADDVVTLMDWLTPPGEPALAAHLAEVCQRFAQGERRGVLVAWPGQSSPHHAELRALGFEPWPGPWVVAGRVWDGRLSLESVSRGLILTFGDMDFL